VIDGNERAQAPAMGDASRRDRWLRRLRPGAMARSSVFVMLWSGVRLAAQLVWVLLLARRLGASTYGTFSGIASLALAISGFVGLGLGLRMYQCATRDPATFSAGWRLALQALALTGLVLAILFFPIALKIFHTADWGLLLAIALSELVLAPVVSLVAYGYASHGWMGHAAAAPVLLSCARILAVLALYLFPLGVSIGVYGWLHALATGLAAAALLWIFTRRMGIRHTDGSLRWIDVRTGLGFSAIQASGLALTTLDKSFALRWGGDIVAGRYVAAYRFVSVVALPVDSLMMVAMPRLFKAGEKRGRGSFSMLLALAFVMGGYGALMGGLIWYSADVLPWLLGSSFVGTQIAVRMLAAYVPLYCIRTLGTNILLGFDWKRWRFAFELTALVCMYVVAAWRIPEAGLSGAVEALLAAELVLGALAWARVLFGLALRRPEVA